MKFTLVQIFLALSSAIAMVGGAGSLSARAQTDATIGDRPLFANFPAVEITERPTPFLSESSANPALEMLRSSGVTETLDAAQLLVGTRSLSVDGDLLPKPTPSANPAPANEPPVVAQRDDRIEVWRPTRSGPSYVGAAINIGFNEDEASPLGEGGFALISKIGLARQVSVRPSVLFGDDLMFLVPVTIDFPIQDTEDTLQVDVAPYIGSGLAISPDSDNFLGFFGTVGIDRILFSRFMATAALNVGYVEEVEVGIILGGAYTF